MADITSLDLARRAGEQLESASPDLLRPMVKTFAEALMSAEADAACVRPLRADPAAQTSHAHRLSGRVVPQ